ncbi:MAG TPA: hypothetical protein PKY78_06135 [Candidatus Omnitrophota bacterium]|nr:hypothetical protein [Candidatus Omnitrophota bacterium]
MRAILLAILVVCVTFSMSFAAETVSKLPKVGAYTTAPGHPPKDKSGKKKMTFDQFKKNKAAKSENAAAVK